MTIFGLNQSLWFFCHNFCCCLMSVHNARCQIHWWKWDSLERWHKFWQHAIMKNAQNGRTHGRANPQWPVLWFLQETFSYPFPFWLLVAQQAKWSEYSSTWVWVVYLWPPFSSINVYVLIYIVCFLLFFVLYILYTDVVNDWCYSDCRIGSAHINQTIASM